METNRQRLWAFPGGPGLQQQDLGEPCPMEQVHPCVQLQKPACQALQKEVSPGWHGPWQQADWFWDLGDLSPSLRVLLTAGDPMLGLFSLWASAPCLWLDGERQGPSKGPPTSDHLSAPLFPRIALRALRFFSPSLCPREGPPGPGLFRMALHRLLHLHVPPGLSLSSCKMGI